MRRILKDLEFPQQSPTLIYEDNKSAITLAENFMFRPKTKHILRRYNYVRSQVDNGNISLKYIKGTEKSADYLTKIFSKRLFHLYRRHYVN